MATTNVPRILGRTHLSRLGILRGVSTRFFFFECASGTISVIRLIIVMYSFPHPLTPLTPSPSQYRVRSAYSPHNPTYSPQNHPTSLICQDQGNSLTRAPPFRASSRHLSQLIFSFVRAAQARPPSSGCSGRFCHSHHDFCPSTKLPEIFFH
jgi:hypothetical protein